jgi:inhibitor of KinA
VDRHVSALVLALAERLQAEAVVGIVEVVSAALTLPRRETPRTAVPAGSVSIATTLSAIYPLESPGGWHLIGRTPALLWDRWRASPVMLAAGDQVQFRPVSLAEHAALAARSAAGEWRPGPEGASEPSRIGTRPAG